MVSETLRGLWERELRDLHSAEQQIITALPGMISAASSTRLREALESHLERTKIQLERLDLIFKKSGLPSVAAARTGGIDSVLKAGAEAARLDSPPDVRDAAIIAAAQHVEHYEIAGYGCARTWARQLGDEGSADLLQQTLDEESEADRDLTDIAHSGVNRNATAGVELDTAARPRLRYVDVKDLPAANQYRDAKIRNRAGDDIGHIDGFLLDTSGRPYYMVVDSGGFFVGRRYVVPVGRADYRRDERMFSVDLDKDLLTRYPEFHRDAFLSMRDDEARRYEWRVLEAIDPTAARASTSGWDYDRLPYYRQPDWFDRGMLTPSEHGIRTEPKTPVMVSDAPKVHRVGQQPSSAHPMYANERRLQPNGRRASDVH